MHRRTFGLLAAMAAASLAFPAIRADAGGMAPHPVIGWGGNRFLFEVQPEGNRIRLTAYRDSGDKWERYGTTTIRKGQKAPEQGFLQKIWFKGQRLGMVEADMNNPFWRKFPGDDRNGGGWNN